MSVVSSAGAAPGDIDRSFGRGGLVSLQSAPSAYALPFDLAIPPNGAIYVLAAEQRCVFGRCVSEHFVSRLGRNGGVDTSFGVGGRSAAIAPIEGGLYGHSASLALDSDGRIVIGVIDDGGVVLSRLNSNGSVDGSFGVAGVAKLDLPVPVGRARIATQGDGKIVVAAEPYTGYGGDAVIVARYTAQGAPDPSFHGGTPVFTSIGSGFGGFAFAGAGRLLLAGPRCCGADGRAVHLARLDANGAFDTKFGRRGQRFVDDVTDGVGVGAVVVQPNGRIYVAGSGRGSGDAFALRLLPNGRLDRKFGHAGISYMRGSFLEPAGASLDRAGRLLIYGVAPIDRAPHVEANRLTVLRLLSNGRRDRSFGGGLLIRLRSLGETLVAGGGLQKRRSLVVLGSAGECSRTCPPPKNFLVRFLGGTSGSRCLGHRATIVGTRHGEALTGTRGRDVISALAGNDSVRGLGGNDLICGGKGDDTLRGGKGLDRLRGGAGQNRLRQ